MNELPAKLQARADRKSAKRQEKKRQIAESAIEALKELGYANTSLRDIAEKSDLSLGMLHYYFEDKTELIIYCVQLYKQAFDRRISAALEGAGTRDQAIAAFAEALTASIFEDGMAHRLWYDIRTQAMFDNAFRPAVEEIETMLIGIVHDLYRTSGQPDPDNVELAYALLDGVFRYLMQEQLGDRPMTRRQMLDTLRGVMERLV